MPHSSPCDGEVWGSGTGFVMDRLPGVFSFPFVLSLSGTREGACLPLLECVLVSCLASCPPGIRLVPFPEAVLPQPLLPWRLITSGHCRGAEMQLLLCLQFPSSCFHQHFYGLNPALMNSIFSTLTAQCPPRHTFSDVMLCDPTKAVSLLL